MKKLLLSVFSAIALSLFTGCSTTPPAAPVSLAGPSTPSTSPTLIAQESAAERINAIVAQEPGDVSLVLTPILLKNPKYAADVALIARTLPSLLQNGPINVGSVSAALDAIPGLNAQEKADLVYIQIGLPAAIQLVDAITGQTVSLYTNPNVAAIINAFCAGALQAAVAAGAPSS
jgi:hypothetical protein